MDIFFRKARRIAFLEKRLEDVMRSSRNAVDNAIADERRRSLEDQIFQLHARAAAERRAEVAEEKLAALNVSRETSKGGGK